MKKILFASTALVAFAGAAAAEVSLGGRAEVGVVDGTRYGKVTQFHTDVDIDFTLRGEADNGLTFGADLDIDETSGGMPANDDYGVSYFVAFGGARMDAGDVDGGFDWALSEVNLAAASIDDSETWHAGFNGNSGFDGTHDGQIFTFSYTFGDFGAAVSAEVDDAGVDDPVYGLGVKYAGDLGGVTLGVGLGYQMRDDVNNGVQSLDEIAGISVTAALDNGLALGVNYSEAYGNPNLEEGSHWGIGVGYEMNALAVGLNYGEYDGTYKSNDSITAVANGLNAHSSGFGLAVQYDLGGGLTVHFGAGSGEFDDGVNGDQTEDTFSLGLAMSF